jgi:hypothetical protein
MSAGLALDRQPERVALVALGQGLDALRQRRGEQVGRPVRRRGRQDELDVLPEAEIEHLVGLVEDHGPEGGRVEVAPLQVIPQAARRPDDDVRALGEHPALPARVHAAHAGGDPPAGRAVEPEQLALHLKREFTRRRDHQGERRRGRREHLAVADQQARHGEPVRHRLAGAGLGGDEEVAGARGGLQHRGLDRGRIGVATVGEGPREGGGQGRERQARETLNGRAAPGSAPSRGGGIRHRTLYGCRQGSAARAG